jgi:dienelactone hydrolase
MVMQGGMTREVRIPVRHGLELKGYLSVPQVAMGVVLVTHRHDGGGRGAHERVIAEALQAAGLATLLMDLLESVPRDPEGRVRRGEVEVESLTDRFVSATEWIVQDADTQPLNIGYFASDTAAAAALIAAARAPDYVDAVVVVPGSTDVASRELSRLRAATLLIAKEGDAPALALNRNSFEQLRTEKAFETLVGSASLLEDPDSLQPLASLTARWFVRHLTAHLHASPA